MAKEEVLTDIISDDEIQAIRPTTDCNLLIQVLVGFLGTVATGFAVVPLKGTGADYFYGVVNQRGPVQYLELFMFFMIIGLIFLKYRIIKRQSRSIGTVDLDTNIDFENDEDIAKLRSSILDTRDYDTSIALSRMDRLLGLWLHAKEVDRVSSYAITESDRDANSSGSTYALSSVLIWAIPIMGFIGTVMGLGNAVGGFSTFLAGAADLGSIKGAIGDVTKGLGVAFDTTLLALVLSVLAMFPLSSVKRREEILYGEIDNYLEDEIISHLPSTGQQPIVIENLEDSIEAAFRRYIPDPDRYDEVFSQSIEKASSLVEEKFAGLAQGYQSTVNELTARLTASMATVGESIESAMRKSLESVREQDEVFLATRKNIGQQEAEQLKSLIAGIGNSFQNMAEQYRQSSEGLQQVTRESSEKSIQASMQLADRMQEITRLAADIQNLLKIEESLEKSLKGLSQSEEFSQTLQDLRSHLSTTTEFCNRMSKPRIIKLREVVGE